MPSEAKRQWCGAHAPSKPGLCTRHGVQLYELHDEEIRKIYGIEAIFYCPERGCDDVDYDTRSSSGSSDLWASAPPGTAPDSWDARLAREVFKQAIRLKVLFKKLARELEDRAEQKKLLGFMSDM